MDGFKEIELKYPAIAYSQRSVRYSLNVHI